MISIQPQYSYTVVETLMQHLDQNLTSSPRTKTALAIVLSKIITIGANESVGPSALDITNNLLTHLRRSTLKEEQTNEESQYQEALINALGEFANNHHDYQKIEIMLFIMNTVPDSTKTNNSDQMLQKILLKSLLKVGVQYRTTLFEKAFPASFLQPLLRMARANYLPTRLIVMQIFQALLDRNKNQVILSEISITDYAALSLESPSRLDILFFHKHKNGEEIMRVLLDILLLDEDIDGITATYNTAALLIVEVCCGQTIQEFLLFILGIQQLAVNETNLSNFHRCNLHIISIALLSLVCRVTGVNSLLEYCEKIITERVEEAKYLLPPLIQSNRDQENCNLSVPHLMIDKVSVYSSF